MIHAMMLILLQQPPTAVDDGRIAALEASAQRHLDAKEFIAAADDYLTLAPLPGADRNSAEEQAHIALESAYFASTPRDHKPLCRGLALAQQNAKGSPSEQTRLSWAEIAAEDRRLLRDDGGVEQCNRGSRVAMLSAEGGMRLPTPEPTPALHPALTDVDRRANAKTTAGAALVGLGAGFTALMGVMLDVHRRRHDELRAVDTLPDGQSLTTTEANRLAAALYEAQTARGAAIVLGTSGGVMLAVGVGLLASNRRSKRAVAFAPYGTRHGAGATLRLNF